MRTSKTIGNVTVFMETQTLVNPPFWLMTVNQRFFKAPMPVFWLVSSKTGTRTLIK